MTKHRTVEVINPEGWRKDYPLRDPITHVGSDPDNDIVLAFGQNTGVQPHHLQIILQPDAGYNLINLTEQEVVLGALGQNVLPPYASMDVVGGQHVKLGAFTLAFPLAGAEAGLPAGNRKLATVQTVQRSAMIGLGLALYETVLTPDQPLEGVVTVSNLSQKPDVQFKLAVQGLAAECYYLEPAPMLLPNVEGQVLLRFTHTRRPHPAAGEYQVNIRASAPNDYPGESTIVSTVIQILPFYDYEVDIDFET